jgi:hypothetical protein
MTNAGGLRGGIFAIVVLILGAAGPSHGQNAPAGPPLRPGEVLVPANNCAYVSRGVTGTGTASPVDMVFHGECRMGLAHGRGVFLPPGRAYNPNDWSQQFHLGRQLKSGGTFLRSVSYLLEPGRTASFRGDAQNPVWSRDLIGGTSVTVGKVTVSTAMSECSFDRKQFRGCPEFNGYPVYGVDVHEVGGSTRTVWCPDPRTTTTCLATWLQTAGSTLTEANAIRDATLAADRALIAELDALYAAYEAALAEGKRAQATTQVNTGLSAINAALARMRGQ